MDKELESTLKSLTETVESQKKAIEATMTEGKARDEKFAGLEKDHLEMQKKLQEKAERNAAISMIGSSVDDKRKALGMLFLGMHANKCAQATYGYRDGVKSLGKNDKQAKELGWWGEQREIATAMIEKAAQWSDDTTGGAFVGHNVMADEWVPLLVPSAKILLTHGAKWTDLPANAGGLTIPRQVSDPTVGTTSENGAPVTSDAKWEMISLTPKRASGGGFISNRLLFSYNKYVEILENRLQYTLMRTIQRYALYGKGAEGQTKGVYWDPKVQKYYISSNDGTLAGSGTAANGKVMSWEDVAYLEEALANNNARIEGAGLIARPEVIRGMKRFHYPQFSGDTAGSPSFNFMPGETLLSDSKLRDTIGYDYSRLTDIAKGNTVGTSSDCSDVFFGQWDNVDIYSWGGIKVKFSDTATLNGISAFEQNFLAILVETDYDVMIRQPLELVVIPDAKTSRQNL